MDHGIDAKMEVEDEAEVIQPLLLHFREDAVARAYETKQTGIVFTAVAYTSVMVNVGAILRLVRTALGIETAIGAGGMVQIGMTVVLLTVHVFIGACCVYHKESWQSHTRLFQSLATLSASTIAVSLVVLLKENFMSIDRGPVEVWVIATAIAFSAPSLGIMLPGMVRPLVGSLILLPMLLSHHLETTVKGYLMFMLAGVALCGYQREKSRRLAFARDIGSHNSLEDSAATPEEDATIEDIMGVIDVSLLNFHDETVARAYVNRQAGTVCTIVAIISVMSLLSVTLRLVRTGLQIETAIGAYGILQIGMTVLCLTVHVFIFGCCIYHQESRTSHARFFQSLATASAITITITYWVLTRESFVSIQCGPVEVWIIAAAGACIAPGLAFMLPVWVGPALGVVILQPMLVSHHLETTAKVFLGFILAGTSLCCYQTEKARRLAFARNIGSHNLN